MSSPGPRGQALREELEQLLNRGTIAVCSPRDLRACSRVFLVPKKNGKYRFIHDLRAVNRSFSDFPVMRLPTFREIAASAPTGGFAAVIDIAAAFHMVKISPYLSSLFGFAVDGTFYKFLAAPFGFAGSPYLWASFFRPILDKIRSSVAPVTVTAYVDDILFLDSSEERVRVAVATACQLLTRLGFGLKLDARSIPAQRNRFLGFDIDLRHAPVLSTTSARTGPLAASCGRWSESRSMSWLDAARLLGGLRSLRPAAPWILVDTALFAHWHARLSRSHRRCSTLPVPVREELRALVLRLRAGFSTSLRIAPPSIVLTTDASGHGWGAHLSTGEQCQGLFSPSERTAPACVREMYAVCHALLDLADKLQGHSLLVRSDSTVVVVSLQAKRARAFDLIEPMRLIRDLSRLLRGLHASHIPGIENHVADRLSRMRDTGVHLLSRQAYASAVATLVLPAVDLFGSSRFAQLPQYVAPRADTRAIGCNAFTVDWAQFRVCWANPPFGLLARTLAHFRACAEQTNSEFKLLLVTPANLTQSWSVCLPDLAEAFTDLPPGAMPASGQPWPVRVWQLSASRARRITKD